MSARRKLMSHGSDHRSLRRSLSFVSAAACAGWVSVLAATPAAAAAGPRWLPVSQNLGTFTAFAFDPLGSGVVYAAAANGLILRSADRGATWSRQGIVATGTATAGGPVHSLAVSPRDPNLLYAGAPG